MYFLMLVGFTLLFSGLYFAVSSVDTTIHNTKEKVEINTELINQIKTNDSLHWVEITKKTDERWAKQDSLHNEILKKLKKITK